MREEKTFKCGYAALIGRPNVGKSSIINALLKEKVSAVSPKPQTTRNAVRCIYTTESEQIIFVDTPGVHAPQNALGSFMVREAAEALSLVDVICFVVDAGDRSVGAKEEAILEMLGGVNSPVILVLNKVDKLADKEHFRKTAEIYGSRMRFAAAVPISAATGYNLDKLVDEISRLLPRQPAIYPADMLMDTTERFLAAEIVREKILLFTEEEVPHEVAVVVEEFKSPEEFPELKTCRIRATIIVERDGQKGIIIGKGGAKLKAIGSAARKELEEKFGYPVFLELWVKVKPGWRKSPEELRRLGYSF